jgi:hypothetical protein
MLNVANTHGLVCGYSVDNSGEMTAVAWSGMDAALAAEGALVWLHFDQADAGARGSKRRALACSASSVIYTMSSLRSRISWTCCDSISIIAA